jgi:hypothetical protein
MSNILSSHPLSPDAHVYVCPHTDVCVLILLYVCAHTTIYVCSYCCICVLILLYVCPHPSIYVSSSFYRTTLRVPMIHRHRRWTSDRGGDVWEFLSSRGYLPGQRFWRKPLVRTSGDVTVDYRCVTRCRQSVPSKTCQQWSLVTAYPANALVQTFLFVSHSNYNT